CIRRMRDGRGKKQRHSQMCSLLRRLLMRKWLEI
nr:hypothetical protein [Tanacetum cinerariifolium]